LAKQKTSLKYILKINSTRIRKANWDLKITLSEAMENDEIVSLADSSVIRFIKQIHRDKSENNLDIEKEIKKVKNEIKRTKKESNSLENRVKIKNLYIKLNDLRYVPEYICVIIDKISDFDRMNRKKGFYINGKRFNRLLATTGGAKNSTVVYMSEDIHEIINNKIDNGRNKNITFVPAKLEAYKALSCSASVPVSDPKGIIVVKDCITSFKENVIRIYDEEDSKFPKMEDVDDCLCENNASDGFGLALPSLLERWNKELGEDYVPSGMCIRGSFIKGMIFPFMYTDFADTIAKKDTVIDIWGDERNIHDAELILTESMLKLWGSYDNMEHYLRCCKENSYTLSVTKVAPEKLENQRNLNYQFIQSLDLSDEQIDSLIYPTVRMIKDSLGDDHMKSLLFLRGDHLTDENVLSSQYDFSMAIMADHRMNNDPFIKNRIYDMISKRIDDAKKGDLIVEGNFSIASGDPYSLCQSMFGIAPTGILKAGEFYSNHWNEKDISEVVAFRAPMTLHNNIRTFKLIKSEETEKWYKHMKTVTIVNSFDSTANALNGMDFDADLMLTVNNDIIKGAVKNLKPIICTQKSADKIIPDEQSLIKANKLSFGDEIGAVTNRGTAMYDVLATLDKDSNEYKEVLYRITCVQHYQQNAIDKTKGIQSNPMPKEWYDKKNSELSEKDNDEIKEIKRLNNLIVADKKPYFFIYIYPHLMKKYKRYIANNNTNCNYRFGISLKQMLNKKNKSDEESEFIKSYLEDFPVSLANSTMNRICWKIENEFKTPTKKSKDIIFDYKIMKSVKYYDKSLKNKIVELHNEHNQKIQSHMRYIKNSREEDETKSEKRQRFIEEFRKKALELCSDIDELTNIIIDICYKEKNKKTKQFLWDVCGEQIVKNLLQNNDGKLRFPVQDESGDIIYGGLKFKETEKIYYEVDLDEIDFE